MYLYYIYIVIKLNNKFLNLNGLNDFLIMKEILGSVRFWENVGINFLERGWYNLKIDKKNIVCLKFRYNDYFKNLSHGMMFWEISFNLGNNNYFYHIATNITSKKSHNFNNLNYVNFCCINNELYHAVSPLWICVDCNIFDIYQINQEKTNLMLNSGWFSYIDNISTDNKKILSEHILKRVLGDDINSNFLLKRKIEDEYGRVSLIMELNK